MSCASAGMYSGTGHCGCLNTWYNATGFQDGICISPGCNLGVCCTNPGEEGGPYDPDLYPGCSIIPSGCSTQGLLGSSSIRKWKYQLSYPILVDQNFSFTCPISGLNLIENSRRVILEDGSCVEMLCPECNNYQECTETS
jgi:hypothetical protein